MEETTMGYNEDSSISFYKPMNLNKTLSNEKDPLLMILIDRSQLVMTIIGFLANIATSITLIENGQVSFTVNKFIDILLIYSLFLFWNAGHVTGRTHKFY